ncbi:hypothetical protein BDF20DRAFT_378622 [Mycotypha africana]|uniref:uncharacterized protein n=1 Tax=Mycotypha africana TaxID=64632 RepID=UPI002301E282|nr:uncharacterized protein BDF20DRAFT_378622 [Mycotypha africana]KAI8984319.1 hypothetical protein BDF20DRAFT_378622 [Mycotypha africana]
MQQQHVQQRNVSFALLTRAEVLCNTWRRVYTKVLQILQSLDNNIAQKLATKESNAMLNAHEVNKSRLIFEQTINTENLIEDLQSTLKLLKEVCDDWEQLESDASRHMNKSLKEPVSRKPVSLSTSSLIDVTSVSPTDVHGFIANLSSQHLEEYNSKRVLFAELSSYLSNEEMFRNLLNELNTNSFIDEAIEKELKERVQLYKTVKKVLESVD